MFNRNGMFSSESVSEGQAARSDYGTEPMSAEQIPIAGKALIWFLISLAFAFRELWSLRASEHDSDRAE